METDEEPVMLSALQHYLFCPRQFALIHIEGVWRENYLTASGRIMHERVDRVAPETRRDVHTATALRLVSHRVGLVGVADRVDFYRVESAFDGKGNRIAAPLPGRSGFWRPFPVEYKRGKPKAHRADEVQLCAQSLCLEEMLDVTIENGALFYGETRRQTKVVFDEVLRRLTETTAIAARMLVDAGVTPPAVRHEGCDACSLRDVCRPEVSRSGTGVRSWIDHQIAKSLGDGVEP